MRDKRKYEQQEQVVTLFQKTIAEGLEAQFDLEAIRTLVVSHGKSTDKYFDEHRSTLSMVRELIESIDSKKQTNEEPKKQAQPSFFYREPERDCHGKTEMDRLRERVFEENRREWNSYPKDNDEWGLR